MQKIDIIFKKGNEDMAVVFNFFLTTLQITLSIYLKCNKFNLTSKNQGLRLLVDAEYTYMNPGISAMALGMMLAFNKVK